MEKTTKGTSSNPSSKKLVKGKDYLKQNYKSKAVPKTSKENETEVSFDIFVGDKKVLSDKIPVPKNSERYVPGFIRSHLRSNDFDKCVFSFVGNSFTFGRKDNEPTKVEVNEPKKEN